MDNQNMMIEVTVDNDATQRCVGLLKELMAVQEKAMRFLDTYKNLYDMPAKEQKAFTDSFAQAVMDTFNDKKKGYDDLMEQRTSKAFKENNKADYDWAVHQHTIQVDNLVEERQLLTDKYNKFIKVKI